MSKKTIGYWGSAHDKTLPLPVANTATDAQVRTMLSNLTTLTEDATSIGYRGWSICRICHKHNGSREYQSDTHIIPEGLKHYIVDHKVLVPELL